MQKIQRISHVCFWYPTQAGFAAGFSLIMKTILSSQSIHNPNTTSLLGQNFLCCLLLHFVQNLYSQPHQIRHAKQTAGSSVGQDSSTIIIPWSLLRRPQHSLKPKSLESLIFSDRGVRYVIANNCLLIKLSIDMESIFSHGK